MQASVTPDRTQELLELLQSIKSAHTCTKHRLLSIIGKLAFACKVVPPGRIFLRRLIDLSTTVGPLHHHITLNQEARLDIQWWLHFLPAWPGTSLFLESDWTLAPHMHLYTDASNLGYGAYWDGTDPFRQGHTLHIAPTATSTCPAAALSKYLAVSRIAAEAPLFQFADGSYYSSSLFASHSFRIGAATTAAAAGLPDWLIQALGRWSSNCYTLYIRTPLHVIAAASAKLATFSACPSATHQALTVGLFINAITFENSRL